MGAGITGILQWASGYSNEDLYGKKPIIPDWPEINESQLSAVRSNTAALPEIEQAASGVNRFNADEIEKMISAVIPDYKQIMGKASSTLKSEVAGEIPQDVQDQIARRSAERGVGSFGGSSSPGSITRYGEARNIGLTSLDIANKGLDSAGRWLSVVRNNLAPVYDPTNMFISPAQRFAADTGKFSRDLYANTISAAPDPGARGSWDTEMGFLGEVLSAYSGGAGYQQTYRGPQGYPSGGGGGYNVAANGYGGGASSYIPAGGDYRGGAGPSYDYGGNNYGGWEDQGYGGGGGGGAGVAMAFV